MPGLEPGIHLSARLTIGMDGRVRPGHDEWGCGYNSTAAHLSGPSSNFPFARRTLSRNFRRGPAARPNRGIANMPPSWKFKFNGRILFIGYGSVSRCTLPLVERHFDIPLSPVPTIDAQARSAALSASLPPAPPTHLAPIL